MSWFKTPGASVDGPSVATILVFGIPLAFIVPEGVGWTQADRRVPEAHYSERSTGRPDGVELFPRKSSHRARFRFLCRVSGRVASAVAGGGHRPLGCRWNPLGE